MNDDFDAPLDDAFGLEDLEAGYRAMAEDTECEAEALEWSEALIGDITNVAW